MTKKPAPKPTKTPIPVDIVSVPEPVAAAPTPAPTVTTTTTIGPPAVEPAPAPAAPAARATRDPQDPLPESNWLFRRLLVFATAIAVLVIICWVIRLISVMGVRAPVAAINGLVVISCWLLAVIIVDRLLYLIAPSAETAAKWFASISAMKAGVSFNRAPSPPSEDRPDLDIPPMPSETTIRPDPNK